MLSEAKNLLVLPILFHNRTLQKLAA